MSLVLTLSLVVCMFCSSSAFAAMDNSSTTMNGYVGRIGLYGGADVIENGDTIDMCVQSSKMVDDTSKLTVTWSISDSNSAAITDIGYNTKLTSHRATVNFLKAGVTVVVHATVNGVQLDRTLTSLPTPTKATSVTLSNNAVSLNGRGKTANVSVKCGPADARLIAGDVNPTVTSGNPHIATAIFYHLVTGETYFTVTGVANGTTSIYVKTASGPSATCLVTVTGAGKSAPAVTLDTKKYSGKSGNKYTFLAKSNDGTVISAKSNNSAVVRVGKPLRSSKGWLITLTGVKAGTTTITATSKSGATASFLATVY